MRRSANGVSKVYMQKDNPEGFDVLYQYVQDCIPKPGDGNYDNKKLTEKKQKDKGKKSSQEDSHLSYRVSSLQVLGICIIQSLMSVFYGMALSFQLPSVFL